MEDNDVRQALPARLKVQCCRKIMCDRFRDRFETDPA